MPSPKKPRKPRGKKRKVGAINLGRGREEGPSMMSLIGQGSLDERDETEGGCSTEVSVLGKLKEEEYEGNAVTLETPAMKRVKSEVE